MNVRIVGGPHEGEVAEIADVSRPGFEFPWPPDDEATAKGEVPHRYRFEADGTAHHLEIPGLDA